MIHPTGARVLVRRIQQAQPSSSTIIIPETIEQKMSSFAMVYSVGNKVRENVKVGDIVVVKDYSGAPVYITVPGDEAETECAILNEDDILAVVEGV